MYEVDNRYPEVADMYEKIRGVKHHGALNGARELTALKRASRINNLKRSFWTSAAAVVSVITLLLVSPGESEAVEEPFLEPSVSIVSAVQSEAGRDEVLYQYEVEMNSADSVDVTVVARTEDHELVGGDGPFRHTESETSDFLLLKLSEEIDFSQVVLDVTCTYTYQGENIESHAVKIVDIRGRPPEPVTEPTGEPVTEPTEPVTEVTEPTETAPTEPTETEPTEPTETEPTEPTEPFTAPTLRITEAALNGTDVSPLSYRCQVELNSAERMTVTAVVTSNTGARLGTGGTYTHTNSGTSAARNVNLTWTTRPTSVTLTVVGTYDEDGETKTVTATRTLQVPEAPFTAPTLRIAEAKLNGTAISPLTYSYRVTLNSAESMRVTATVTSNTGTRIGGDGPYTHTASGTSPDHSVNLTMPSTPTSVTLTLTGTYTEKGVTKTVTATQTMTVSASTFTAPTLSIVSASLNDPNITPLTYSYRVTLNSAENMSVTAEVTANGGARLGTDGPYNHTAAGVSPTRSMRLSWSTRPTSVTLTLTGTYTENGTTKTVTATRTMTAPEAPFTAPTMRIVSASLNGSDVTPLSFSYQVTLNSAQSLQVTAVATSEGGTNLGSGSYTHTATGTSPTRSLNLSWTTRPTTVTLKLTGTYQERGTTKTITATQTLTVPEEPFTAPTLRIVNAALDSTDVSPLTFTYNVALNSASSLSVTAKATSDTGVSLGTGGAYAHTGSGNSPERSIPLTFTSWPSTVTLTLTGTYQDKSGANQTVTATRTLTAPTKPFEGPELKVESATLILPDYIIVYKYTVDLKDADQISVDAVFSYEEEDALGQTITTEIGTDGTYLHESSLTTDPIKAIADEYPEEFPAKVLLTGTYLDDTGAEQKITADGLLALFNAPQIDIDSARWDNMTANTVIYDAHIYLEDADSIQVNASVEKDGTTYGTAGPYDFTAETQMNDYTLTTDSDPGEDAILILIGTYEVDGLTLETGYSEWIDEANPFEGPELELESVERGTSSDSAVTYQFSAVMNSVPLLKVWAEFYDDGSGTPIYQTEPMMISDEGPFTVSCDTGTPATRMVLKGEYERMGTTHTVQDSRDLPTLTPFTPPSFNSPSASLSASFSSYSGDIRLGCNTRFSLGDAESLTVYAKVTSDLGTIVGTGGSNTYSASDSYSDELLLTLTGAEKTLTVTFIGEYYRGSTKYEITADVDVVITMGGYDFDSGGEANRIDSSTVYLEYWAKFRPNDEDPHKEEFDFQVTEIIVYWYRGGLLGTAYVTSDITAVSCEYSPVDGTYNFSYNGNVEDPYNSEYMQIQLNVVDRSTGKQYSTTTADIPS